MCCFERLPVLPAAATAEPLLCADVVGGAGQQADCRRFVRRRGTPVDHPEYHPGTEEGSVGTEGSAWPRKAANRRDLTRRCDPRVPARGRGDVRVWFAQRVGFPDNALLGRSLPLTTQRGSSAAGLDRFEMRHEYWRPSRGCVHVRDVEGGEPGRRYRLRCDDGNSRTAVRFAFVPRISARGEGRAGRPILSSRHIEQLTEEQGRSRPGTSARRSQGGMGSRSRRASWPFHSYDGLAGGDHTFAVRAAGGSGNVDATPAIRNWTVSASVPPVPRAKLMRKRSRPAHLPFARL